MISRAIRQAPLQKQSTPLAPLSTWPHYPLVSLLVAAWNEAAQIEAFLASFAALDYPNKELILCAGGTDQTFVLAKRWAGAQITILEQSAGTGKFRALQQCLDHATGVLIALTDADCILNQESFMQLIYPLVSGEATVTTGSLCPLQGQWQMPFVVYQWAQMHYDWRKAMRSSTDSPFLAGGNSALLRPIIEEAYATTLPMPVGEDTYLALFARRAGHRILRVAESTVETVFPQTLPAYIRQRSRWRRDQVLHAYRFGNRLIGWKALFSVCKHLVWLMLPLLPFLLASIGLGLWGIILWSTVWLTTFAIYYYRYRIGRWEIETVSEIKITDPLALHLWKLMIADSCAVIHLAICMVVPTWRYLW